MNNKVSHFKSILTKTESCIQYGAQNFTNVAVFPNNKQDYDSKALHNPQREDFICTFGANLSAMQKGFCLD